MFDFGNFFKGGGIQQTHFASSYQISYRPIKLLERYCDFCDYKDGGRRHLLGFSKIQNCNDGSTISVQCASLCKMSSKSGKRSQRHGDLTVLFKMAAVCHLGLAGHVLRPPTMTT